jgi:alpha-amylase
MGRGRTIAYEKYLESRERVRPGHLLAHFLSSHDVTGALRLLGGDREAFRLAATLQLTTSGIPTIFYGEEVAREIGDWPLNRTDMPWGDRAVLPGAGKPRDEAMRSLYRSLIAIRREHPALSRGTHAALSVEGDLLAFVRRLGQDAVVVAVNRGKEPAVLRASSPQEWAGSPVRDLLTGELVEARGGVLELSVAGRTARILAPGPAAPRG